MKRTRPAARNGGWKRGPSRTSSALQTRALAPHHGRVTVLRASGGHREGDLREATACHTELGRGDQQRRLHPAGLEATSLRATVPREGSIRQNV